MSIETDELNKKKLELEIAELVRPIWQRPAFITPVIAALLSVMLAYFSGWFDVQLTRLSNQRHDLEQDIAKFQREKSEIQGQVDALRKELTDIKSKLDAANTELKDVKQKLDVTNRELKDAKDKLDVANRETEDARLQLIMELISRKSEKKELEGNIESLTKQLKEERTAKRNQIEAELKKVEQSYRSSQKAERKVIDRIRTAFGISEKSLAELEQEVRKRILQTQKVDADGCFFVGQEQHCLNF